MREGLFRRFVTVLKKFMGSSHRPVVRTRRDLMADLFLIFLGLVALAIPAGVVRYLDSSAGEMLGGSIGILQGDNPKAGKDDELARQLIQLKEENRRLVDSLRRIEEFRVLAGRLGLSPGQYVPAVVLGARQEAGRWRYLISAGREQGIGAGSGVILGCAAFGVTESVSGNTAWVVRIDAPPVKVPAIIIRSRAEGLMEATAEGISLSFVRVAEDPDRPWAAVHDMVLTSGRSGIFPPGVWIGRISGVGRTEDGLFHVIDVEPEFEHISGDGVVVWKSAGGEPEAGGE